MRIPATETRGGLAHLMGKTVFPNVQCGCCGFWRPREEASYYLPEDADPEETITAGFYCNVCWKGLADAGVVLAAAGLAEVG